MPIYTEDELATFRSQARPDLVRQVAENNKRFTSPETKPLYRCDEHSFWTRFTQAYEDHMRLAHSGLLATEAAEPLVALGVQRWSPGESFSNFTERAELKQRTCAHEVYSIYEPTGIDAARSVTKVQCSECSMTNEATVTISGTWRD